MYPWYPMTKRLDWVLAVALFVVAGAVYLAARNGVEPSGSSRSMRGSAVEWVPEPKRLDQPTTPQRGLATSTEDAQNPRPRAPANGILAVSVVDGPTDSPVPRIVVRAKATAKGGTRTLEVTTDENGGAVFHYELPATLERVSVGASTNRIPASVRMHQLLQPGERHEVRIELESGRSLSGHVVDDQGGPLAGAQVLAWCGRNNEGPAHRRTLSGPNGSFLLDHLGPRFVAVAELPPWACVSGLQGKLNATTHATELKIRMGPARTLSGTILGPGHEPIAGAEVWVAENRASGSGRHRTGTPGVFGFEAASSRTVSQAGGRFSLSGLPAGRQVRLCVRYAPFLVYSAHHLNDGQPVVAILESGSKLRGRVTDRNGHPAHGARVTFGPHSSNVISVPEFVVCDTSGQFQLRGMLGDRASPHFLHILHAGHAIELVQPVWPGPDGGEAVDVRLDAEHTLSGRVIDKSGEPLAGVELWIEGDRTFDPGFVHGQASTWEWAVGIDRQYSDETGRFLFRNLYDGSFMIHAVFPDDDRSSVDERVGADDDAIEIVMTAPGQGKVVLHGTVRDSVTNSPVEAFTITPFVDDAGLRNAFEDEKGEYRLGQLSPGALTLEFSAPGYAPVRLPAQEYEVGVHRLDIGLDPSTVLHLTVQDESGERYTTGNVQAFGPDGRACWMEAGVQSRATALPLHGDQVVIAGLPAGSVVLRVDLGFGPYEEEVFLSPGGENETTLVVPRRASRRLDIFLALNLGPASDETVLKAWIAAVAEKDAVSLAELVATGTVSHPHNPVVVEARFEGDLIARVEIKPLPDGAFQVTKQVGATRDVEETKSPTFSLRAPVGKIELTARGKSAPSALSYSIAEGEDSPTLILLRPE